MKQAEFKLAVQSGNRGYFGKVVLHIESNGAAGGVKVDFDPQRAADWQAGARFGIDYVLEHVSIKKLFPEGATIHVDAIQGHPVDTTNVVVAYAAANALIRALEIELAEGKMPKLDEKNGLFVFPK
jgi:hypothetical protein